MLKVDRLASSNLLALSEVQEFASALAMMNASLEVSDQLLRFINRTLMEVLAFEQVKLFKLEFLALGMLLVNL